MFINFWYPTCESKELEAGKALHVKILGLDFAVFRDSKGEAHCVSNVCVHRGASLAHGKVKGDAGFEVTVDEARVYHWLKVGAQPSESVMKLFKTTGTLDRWVDEALLVLDVVLEFGPELLHEGAHRHRGRIAERADGAALDVVGHRVQQVDVFDAQAGLDQGLARGFSMGISQAFDALHFI